MEATLRQRSYETFLPTYVECRSYSDRIKKVDAALFPGYLFCRFDPDRRLPILTTAGVQQILCLNERPVPVDEGEIAAIQRVVKSQASAQPWPYLKAGDSVRVEFGCFSGMEGILVTEKGTDRLIVSITMLQRSVSVQIDRSWVRPLSRDRKLPIAV